mmetsp:Transcript_90581/g.143060  ORF Transcript_90581/g.143060 Transcript_90581/m.143060 type:complete len:222 (-) Transcript_90581:585-1250(-)
MVPNQSKRIAARRRPSSCRVGRYIIRSHEAKPNEDTQVTLLQDRGDLCNARLNFNVELKKPSAETANPLTSLGLQLQRAEDVKAPLKLRVADIVEIHGGVRTSVGAWNRGRVGQGETHLAVKPGDLICSINGSSDYDDILEGLATMPTPRRGRKCLSLQRELPDLLAPAANRITSATKQMFKSRVEESSSNDKSKLESRLSFSELSTRTPSRTSSASDKGL